jgi:hypothetical protein
MGAVKTEELANGNIGLEITYGGMEAPFGGVDTSAPPAYIDPKCFTQCDGFIVIDNKLVAVSYNPFTTPTLWNGVSNVILLKIGTFYNSITGQLNYALGYTAAPFGVTGTSPTGVNYTFYMTSWDPGNMASCKTDILPITLFDAVAIYEQASLTLDCIATGAITTSAGAGATGTIVSVDSSGRLTSVTCTGGTGYALNDIIPVLQDSNLSGYLVVTGVSIGGVVTTTTIFNTGADYHTGGYTAGTTTSSAVCELQVVGPSGTYTTHIVSWSLGYTRQNLIADMSGGNIGPDVTISASVDGYSLIITANSPGVIGNSITVQDLSTSIYPATAPPFYFSARLPRNLEGGQITEVVTAPLSFPSPTSTAEVGGTLYIANLGPMILKYSGPGLFTTSSLYNGVGVIRKFAGSLIGLRLEPQLGIYTQNQDMIFAWSSALNLDEWSPETAAGNVTGAGFEQLADIGDYLTGLFVSNGTAFIVRSQGLSYATATGNATSPFTIAHIGLGEQGEGAQATALVCQYDQTGAFVGNSNVYQVSGTISAIGDKIKKSLFSTLASVTQQASTTILASKAGNAFIAANVCVLICISIASTMYIYNASNGTWVTLSLPFPMTSSDSTFICLDIMSPVIFYARDSLYSASQFILASQHTYHPLLGSPTVFAPSFFKLTDGIGNINSANTLNAIVAFPQEELLFGRDVTIDALYVSLFADVSADTTVNFYINGILFSSLVLTSAVFNSLTGIPIECQVFPTSIFTSHSPQLSYQITPFGTTDTAQLQFVKIQLFGSFDPKQRPV